MHLNRWGEEWWQAGVWIKWLITIISHMATLVTYWMLCQRMEFLLKESCTYKVLADQLKCVAVFRTTMRGSTLNHLIRCTSVPMLLKVARYNLYNFIVCLMRFPVHNFEVNRIPCILAQPSQRSRHEVFWIALHIKESHAKHSKNNGRKRGEYRVSGLRGDPSHRITLHNFAWDFQKLIKPSHNQQNSKGVEILW